MKICPKCSIQHGKNGSFCSRKCANSRNFSAESRLKKSVAQARHLNTLPEDVKAKRIDVLNSTEAQKRKKSTWLKKRIDTPWDDLSWDTKRKLVIFEQQSKCAQCNLSEWRGQKIILEVDHINGNNKDNKRENLEAVCPNCHSLTETWRGRNKQGLRNKISDEQLIKALSETGNVRQALLQVGLAAKGGNYQRAKKLRALSAGS